jgi:catechol 2,3-dioxygenase-like lactoylglutathione lyase family enzyme
MILYVTLGTNNLELATSFYDPTMSAIGFKRHITNHDEIGYGPQNLSATLQPRSCLVWITKPVLKLPATWGNGTMLALPASTHVAVQAFHKAALAHGGYDEGAPGLRPYHAKFYACYVRDPDGNKLSAVCEN